MLRKHNIYILSFLDPYGVLTGMMKSGPVPMLYKSEECEPTDIFFEILLLQCMMVWIVHM
jgi:hypothetical protein